MHPITATTRDGPYRFPSRTGSARRRGVMLVLVLMAVATVTTTTTTSVDAFSAQLTTTKGRAGRSGRVLLLRSKLSPSQLQASPRDEGSPRRPVAAAAASAADFERQELKAQMQAMKEQGVAPSNLNSAKLEELEGYVRAIVSKRPSLVPLNQLGDVLPGTRWRLAFTTQPAMAETLPRDVTIRMSFAATADVEEGAGGGNNLMDYSLDFAKTLGLKRINARSTYSVDSSPANPGLVSIVYDSITTDVFGLKNLGVGMFGMMKGRATYIPTAYFDGSIWIEWGLKGAAAGAGGGEEYYYNVYAREE